MKKVKQLSVLVSSALLVSNVAYADFGDAVVGGVVGGAVGSVITNEVYNKNKQQSTQPQQRKSSAPSQKYYAPQMTDEKRIQRSLSSLGFYRGRIDGQVNSYETRAAIKEMNMAYEISNNASLKPEAKDTLIFLGTLFEFDRYLNAQSSDRDTQNRKIQAALKLHGYYHGTIDGALGSGSRNAISQYKADNGMGYGGSLDFEQEYQLINSAKEKNDKNIEESIASLKALGRPALQQNKVIDVQQSSQLSTH
ncbi:peptidoglycan-binding protein [Sulfurovum sp. zt1-1]|uniref:Peptidoglycan-binding protein n=1 Tax=Sulfurovum zhangzhouensis TaxID=3019067 RepID=A0ABT7QUX5_9BACT|nr:peptidoglycan-binding protein [Sulfurovum zhangzhouensis]MDM5270647.1 peptidoglycan-binding protein [Sulfurovum zhangzhouensis]